MLYFPIHQLPTSILQLLTPTSISQYFAAMQLRIVLMHFFYYKYFAATQLLKLTAKSPITNLHLTASPFQSHKRFLQDLLIQFVKFESS
jgi:hypothetical protein